jgi:hypothetical protein
MSMKGLISCRSIPRIVPYSKDESGSSVALSLRRRSHKPCISKNNTSNQKYTIMERRQT